MIFSKGFDLKSIFNKFTLQKALANHHLGVVFSLLMEEDFFINEEEELNIFLQESLSNDPFTRQFIKNTLQNEVSRQGEGERGKRRDGKEEGGKRKSGTERKGIENERKDGEGRKEKGGRREERGVGGGGRRGGGREGVETLHRAVDRLDVKMVERLFERGKGEDVDEDGNTPLHLVMGNWGEREAGRKIAEMLVKITTNFNILNKMACTPIHMAVKNSQIFALEWALDWNFRRREEKRVKKKENKEKKVNDGGGKEEDDRRIKDEGTRTEGMREEGVPRRKGGKEDGDWIREDGGGRREEEEEEEEWSVEEERLFDFDKRTGPFLYSPLHLASYIGNSGITELFSRYPREVDFFQKNKSGKTARKVASKSLLQLKLLLKEEKVNQVFSLSC